MAQAVATDASGNIYITGYFQQDSISFGSYTFQSGFCSGSMFLTKYDANGNVLWAKNPFGEARANSIALDSYGNIYVTGYFVNVISFGTCSLHTATYTQDFFTVKFNSAGIAIWAKNSSGGAYGQSIAVDTYGNSVVTGYHVKDTISFDSVTLIRPTGNQMDFFITKYDPDGNTLWAKSASNMNNFVSGNKCGIINNSCTEITGC